MPLEQGLILHQRRILNAPFLPTFGTRRKFIWQKALEMAFVQHVHQPSSIAEIQTEIAILFVQKRLPPGVAKKARLSETHKL